MRLGLRSSNQHRLARESPPAGLDIGRRSAAQGGPWVAFAMAGHRSVRAAGIRFPCDSTVLHGGGQAAVEGGGRPGFERARVRHRDRAR